MKKLETINFKYLRHLYAVLVVALSFLADLGFLSFVVLALYGAEFFVSRRKDEQSSDPRTSHEYEKTRVEAFNFDRSFSLDRTAEQVPIHELAGLQINEKTVPDTSAEDPWSRAIQQLREQDDEKEREETMRKIFVASDEDATPVEPIFHHDFEDPYKKGGE